MEIKIKGAFENDLKHIDLNLPKNNLIVFTGLSLLCDIVTLLIAAKKLQLVRL